MFTTFNIKAMNKFNAFFNAGLLTEYLNIVLRLQTNFSFNTVPELYQKTILTKSKPPQNLYFVIIINS